MNDGDLAARLREGDEQAFRELVQAYGSRVYNTVLGFLQHEQDAEDLTQDVFVRIHSRIGGFTGASSLGTWIYRLTVNLCLDKLRSRKRKRFFSFLTNVSESDNAVDFEHPGVLAENRERAAQLFKAVERLPDRQKAAFVLSKTEGLSYAETAAVLNTTEAAVDALLQRATLNLKKYIQNNFPRGEGFR